MAAVAVHPVTARSHQQPQYHCLRVATPDRAWTAPAAYQVPHNTRFNSGAVKSSWVSPSRNGMTLCRMRHLATNTDCGGMGDGLFDERVVT
jgi:hypothetical protein